MNFTLLDSLSLPGDPAKPNEDAYAAEAMAAVVLDGATPLNEPLMPGRSDAAWIASFGARRLMAHLKEGAGPRAALRQALADAERSYAGLRRRTPAERCERPFASMILAVPQEGLLDLLWYGDCAALVLHVDGDCAFYGTALDKRAAENNEAARFMKETGLAPVEALRREEYRPLFRAARNRTNMPGGTWLFGTEAAASEHVARARAVVLPGTLVLLSTDGFLALAGGYGAYELAGLVKAAAQKGLQTLGAELRAVEADDPEARRFPRFKSSDDATAVLLRLD
jgi:hypothetical protein